jgi:hypothetical protein
LLLSRGDYKPFENNQIDYTRRENKQIYVIIARERINKWINIELMSGQRINKSI